MRTITMLSLITAAGCAPSVETFEADELAETLRLVQAPAVVQGCSDLFVYAATANDTRVLEITMSDGLAADAAEDGNPIERTYTLPDPAVTITAVWGSDLTINHCDDVWFGTPTVDGARVAESGTLTVRVEPTGVFEPWDHSGHATLWLEDVSFGTSQTGAPIDIDLELTDVLVGWYPG